MYGGLNSPTAAAQNIIQLFSCVDVDDNRGALIN